MNIIIHELQKKIISWYDCYDGGLLRTQKFEVVYYFLRVFIVFLVVVEYILNKQTMNKILYPYCFWTEILKDQSLRKSLIFFSNKYLFCLFLLISFIVFIILIFFLQYIIYRFYNVLKVYILYIIIILI